MSCSRRCSAINFFDVEPLKLRLGFESSAILLNDDLIHLTSFYVVYLICYVLICDTSVFFLVDHAIEFSVIRILKMNLLRHENFSLTLRLDFFLDSIVKGWTWGISAILVKRRELVNIVVMSGLNWTLLSFFTFWDSNFWNQKSWNCKFEIFPGNYFVF